MHRKLEEDVRAVDLTVGSMERLFSSPLPPTMSRHIVRCLLLFFFGLPFVLAGTMAPTTVAIWVFVVSYAFIGIDEVGAAEEADRASLLDGSVAVREALKAFGHHWLERLCPRGQRRSSQ